ncbi:MAG: NADH-quinone oxidoreductase subunit K [Idiomarina sp.]|nr:NADH-quinone oxidoreductase subunit K [Idiomarina sp.]
MTSDLWFALMGVALIALAAFTFFRQVHLLRRILAFNIMGSGVFLVMVGMAQHQRETDPVPQALVLTGIVVAVSATALALIIFRRFYSVSGQVELDEYQIEEPTQNEDHASDTMKDNINSLQDALQSDDEAPAKPSASKGDQ